MHHYQRRVGLRKDSLGRSACSTACRAGHGKNGFIFLPNFLPARRYASDGTSYGPVSVCLSVYVVCLSVTSRSSVETTERIKLVFGTGACFYLSYTHTLLTYILTHNRLTAFGPGLPGRPVPDETFTHSLYLSYTVLKGNLGISKYKGTSLWNFFLDSGLRKFHNGISIVETCYQVSSTMMDPQNVIDWIVISQLS